MQYAMLLQQGWSLRARASLALMCWRAKTRFLCPRVAMQVESCITTRHLSCTCASRRPCEGVVRKGPNSLTKCGQACKVGGPAAYLLRWNYEAEVWAVYDDEVKLWGSGPSCLLWRGESMRRGVWLHDRLRLFIMMRWGYEAGNRKSSPDMMCSDAMKLWVGWGESAPWGLGEALLCPRAARSRSRERGRPAHVEFDRSYTLYLFFFFLFLSVSHMLFLSLSHIFSLCLFLTYALSLFLTSLSLSLLSFSSLSPLSFLLSLLSFFLSVPLSLLLYLSIFLSPFPFPIFDYSGIE